MTPQQAKKEFDKLVENKVFKETFLFWEEHKYLIQESFTDLQNELEKISEMCSPKIKIEDLRKDFNGVLSKGAEFGTLSKEESYYKFRQGEILRKLESIKPLPESDEDKAFVVAFRVENRRKLLEKDTFPVLSFEKFKEKFEKESENRDKNILINSGLKKVTKFLLNSSFYCSKDFIDDGIEINLEEYIYDKLDNNCKIDLSVFYNNVTEGWHISDVILARILSPIQYKRFLEIEESNLKNNKPAITKPDVPDTGFNLGYSGEQLTTLRTALTDNNFLEKESNLEHFKNAFNGEVLTNFKKLKWIDKVPRNNAGVDGFNTQSLLEFLYLLEMDSKYYDTLPSNQDNFYRLLERVFEGIKNIQAKNITKKPNQKTLRQKLLKTILQGIKP